jgi:hypothetical protein
MLPFDSRFPGTWKLNDKNDRESTFVIEKAENNNYRLIYKNNLREKPEESVFFLSEIYNRLYLNIRMNDTPVSYNLMAVISFNEAGSKFKACMINDTTLQKAKSSAEVRTKLITHFDDPGYYKDTVEFIRIR